MTSLAIILTVAAAVSQRRLAPEPAVRVGQGAQSSLVYIDFGPRTFWYDVRYSQSITGFAALQLIDEETPLEMESITFGSSQFVSSISLGGYAQSGVGNNGSDFWSYWRRDSSTWSLSGVGASFRTLTDGQSDGWVWTAAQNRPPDEPFPHRAFAADAMPNTVRRASIPEPQAAVAFVAALFGVEKRRRRGFTLVELLVVIGIIGAMMAMLLPAMKNAGEQSRAVQCLSNLRQMMTAVEMYQQAHGGRFPLSGYTVFNPPIRTSYAWDYTRITDTSTGKERIEPGLLWWRNAAQRVMQCPTFDRPSAGFITDPFTGYNYNTSYLGGEQQFGTSFIYAPAKLSQVRKPSQTAVFGDGEYAGGGNKFMRAPFPSGREAVSGGRFAGTQGFRHRGATNVAFADGHAAPIADRHTQTLPGDVSKLARGTGFLSSDNSLYDLD